MTTEPVVPGYHALTRIGRGGLGDVFRAVDDATGTTVAIKILRDVSDSSVAWHRTRRELAALEALSGHPNVIGSVALLELDAGPALVMEYAAGGSVGAMIRERESTPSPGFGVAEAVFVGRQTAAALVGAHSRGIVHRDVKPHNLLIDAAGQIKLCDFGIAALTHDDEYRTHTNAVSMRYASPEDLESDEPVGPPSDVYSLGATLLHLVHGAPPSLRDRLTPWVPPSTSDPDHAAVDALIARCLQPTPILRPTASEVLARLDAIAAAGPRPVNALAMLRFDDFPVVDHEAATVRRPEPELEPERPVMVPRPKIGAASHSRRLIGAAAAAAILIVAAVTAVVLGAFDRGNDALATGAFATAGRPAELPSLTEADWSAGEVGDCLSQVAGATELIVVACTEPHDLQRFAAGSLSDAANAADAARTVDSECDVAFEAFVGRDVKGSDLDIAQTRPSPQSWQAGDREFACYLGIEGLRLTATARSTRW